MTADRKFDRRIEFDPRSRQYPIRALLAAAPTDSHSRKDTMNLLSDYLYVGGGIVGALVVIVLVLLAIYLIRRS